MPFSGVFFCVFFFWGGGGCGDSDCGNGGSVRDESFALPIGSTPGGVERVQAPVISAASRPVGRRSTAVGRLPSSSWTGRRQGRMDDQDED